MTVELQTSRDGTLPRDSAGDGVGSMRSVMTNGLGLISAIVLASCMASPAVVDAAADAEDANVADSSDGQDVPRDVQMCRPDGNCPSDCSAADGPCWACGQLALTTDCQCRASPTGGGGCFWPDCTAPGPVNAGEYCGTYWWCNRACGAGLTCRSMPDAGAGVYLMTCQP